LFHALALKLLDLAQPFPLSHVNVPFNGGLEPGAYVTGIDCVHLDATVAKLFDVGLPFDAGGQP
jgi:hypothetical protein